MCLWCVVYCVLCCCDDQPTLKRCQTELPVPVPVGVGVSRRSAHIQTKRNFNLHWIIFESRIQDRANHRSIHQTIRKSNFMACINRRRAVTATNRNRRFGISSLEPSGVYVLPPSLFSPLLSSLATTTAAIMLKLSGLSHLLLPLPLPPALKQPVRFVPNPLPLPVSLLSAVLWCRVGTQFAAHPPEMPNARTCKSYWLLQKNSYVYLMFWHFSPFDVCWLLPLIRS